MNADISMADRFTHVKIVVVALLLVFVFTGSLSFLH